MGSGGWPERGPRAASFSRSRSRWVSHPYQARYLRSLPLGLLDAGLESRPLLPLIKALAPDDPRAPVPESPTIGHRAVSGGSTPLLSHTDQGPVQTGKGGIAHQNPGPLTPPGSWQKGQGPRPITSESACRPAAHWSYPRPQWVRSPEAVGAKAKPNKIPTAGIRMALITSDKGNLLRLLLV